jgi:hypothetical protein
MFTNPTVFTCPFCEEPTGEVFIDAHACVDRRAEDPDPVDWPGDALDSPQGLIRFGYTTDRRTPCRHLIHARGVVEWHGEKHSEQWWVAFEWTTPRFREVDRGVGATLVGDPEELVELGAERNPPVAVAFARPRFNWDAMASFRNHADIYRINALFVAASRPLSLLKAVEARVRAIRRYAKKLKAKSGETS